MGKVSIGKKFRGGGKTDTDAPFPKIGNRCQLPICDGKVAGLEEPPGY